jgi:hypothetical protein
MELQGSRNRTVRKNIENEFENNRTFYKLNQSEFKKGNQIQEGESESRRGIRLCLCLALWVWGALGLEVFCCVL